MTAETGPHFADQEPKARRLHIPEGPAMAECSLLCEAVYNHAGDGMCVLDMQGRIVEVNRRLCTALGYTREQLLGMHAWDIEDDNDADGFPDLCRRLPLDTPHTFQGLYRRADGSRFPAEVRVVVFARGGERFVLAVGRDITERKKAADALRLSEERYRRIVEDQTELICRSRPDGTLLFVNEVYCRHFGVPRDKLIGTSYFVFLPDDARRKMRAALDSLTPRNPAVTTRHAAVTSSGETRHYEWIDRGIFDESGRLVEVQSVGRDITAEVRAQEALRISEERYRRVIEDHTEMINRSTPDGTVLFVNEACCRHFGIPRDELVGSNYFSLLPEEDRLRLKTLINGLTPENPVATIEHRVLMPDNSVRYHEWINRGIFDEQGNLVEVQSAGRDITRYRQAMLELRRAHEELSKANDALEQRVQERTAELSRANEELRRHMLELEQAEEELRRSEEKYRSIFSAAANLIASVDAAGRIVDCNSCSSEMLGYQPDELIGSSLSRIICGESLQRARQMLHRTLAQGHCHGEEYRMIRKDGAVVDVRVNSSALRDGDGRPLTTIWIIEDITERRRAEEARKESEERYRTLVELSPDAFLFRNLDGVIIQVNSAFEKASGWSREEIVGKTVEEIGLLTPQERRNFERAVIPKLMRDGIVTNVELNGRRRDGSTVPLLVSCTLMRGADGSPTGIIAVGRDITEQKEGRKKLLNYQHQLRSLASELSLAEERSRRETAAVLHDRIGQMLAASKLKLAALRATIEQHEQIEHLNEAISLLDQAIQDTRSLTRELSPPLLYEFGLEAAVRGLAEEFQRQHGIAAVFNDDGTAKPLDNDIRGVLFQAVRELLLNVAKHARARTVRISIDRRPNTVAITVEDDGVGFREDEIGPHQYRPGGFGLFNIRERLRHLGGQLDIDSQPGSGARLTLIAPLTMERMKQ